MAQCPKCGSDKASFKRETAGSKGSGASVSVRVTKNVSVGTGSGSSKRQYQTIGFCPDCGYTWSAKGKSPLVTALLWLCIYIPFFPIALSIWFWKTRRFNLEKKKKAVILVIVWVVILILGILSQPSKDTGSQNLRGNVSAVSTDASAEEEETTEEKVTVKEEKKDTAETKAEEEESVTDETIPENTQTQFVKNERINQFLNSIPDTVELSNVSSSRNYSATCSLNDCYTEVRDMDDTFEMRISPPNPPTDEGLYDVLIVASEIAKILDPKISVSDIDKIVNAKDKDDVGIELDSETLSFTFSPRIDSDDGRNISTGYVELSSVSYGRE